MCQIARQFPCIAALLGTGLLLGALIAAAAPAAAAEPSTAGAAADAADSAALSQILNFDPASLNGLAPRPPRPTGVAAPAGPAIRGADKPDGSGSVAIKQPLPTRWNSAVGLDLTVAPPPPENNQADQPLPGGRSAASSGAAWASIGLPNLADLDARFAPGSHQSHVGTTLHHSIVLGDAASFTVRDRFALSGDLGTADPAGTAPAGLPMMTLPQAAPDANPAPVWSNTPGVTLNILPTGTTLAADMRSASNDSTTHNKLSAEQKIYGPLHVTTSVSDLGEATVNKSVSAGFTLKW